MAGGQERILRRRIKSITSTQKITRAMELIAASQIVRAQGRIVASRPYLQGMTRIVLETALGDTVAAGRLLGTPETIPKAAVLSVVADRGLCGGYNTSVFRATASERTARQRAMAAATDNAGELIKKYSRIMNRARQDTITTEIMEIVSGAEALRAGTGDDQGGLVIETTV